MRFELFIALRYLLAKRKQAFISVISIFSIAGVAIGVCCLIVGMGIMNGFSLDLRDKILGANAHVVVQNIMGGMHNYAEPMAQVAALPGVKAVTPFLYTEVMISNRNGAKGLMLRGIDPESAPKVLGIVTKITEGQITDLVEAGQASASGASGQGASGQGASGQGASAAGAPHLAGEEPTRAVPGLIIGQELAKRLGLGLGSRVNLLSPSGQRSSSGFSTSTKAFKIVAIFSTGMLEYDTSFAFVSLEAAAELTGMPAGMISGLEVAVQDVYKADKIAVEIERVLGQDYLARHWMTLNANLFSALKLEKIAMGLVLTLIILVGSFSIIATLVMLVMEKTKDIAVMMSLGASGRTIRNIFMLQGTIIGLLGTSIGLALGQLISFLLKRYRFIKLPPGVYSTDYLPVVLQAADVASICIGAVLICFLATLYPAFQAAGLQPAEALHYE